MCQKLTVNDLREHLNDYSAHLQEFAASSSADSETKLLFDELAKYYHYILSEIIEYLDQH